MGLEKLGRIRALVSDVDGVMTDGGIVVGEGTETKVFNVRDGLGIKLWQQAGLEFALLSGRTSEPLRRRAEELGVAVVRMGRLDKQTALDEISHELGIAVEDMAYIGDDLPDLAPLRLAAVGFCPSNAVVEVQHAADYVVPLAGGSGVVRYVIEMILKAHDAWQPIVEAFEVRRG